MANPNLEPRGWDGGPTKYGASLGRPSLIPSKEVAECMKVSLQKIRLNQGGYDAGGAYWGIGAPLYWAADDFGIVDMWFRASDRDDAKRQVLSRCPNAMFYR